jgi:hypothetical protein
MFKSTHSTEHLLVIATMYPYIIGFAAFVLFLRGVANSVPNKIINEFQ